MTWARGGSGHEGQRARAGAPFSRRAVTRGRPRPTSPGSQGRDVPSCERQPKAGYTPANHLHFHIASASSRVTSTRRAPGREAVAPGSAPNALEPAPRLQKCLIQDFFFLVYTSRKQFKWGKNKLYKNIHSDKLESNKQLKISERHKNNTC